MEAEARAGGNPVKISNAEQNRIYEEEKRKVWDLQASALSNPIPPVLTVAEEEAARNAQPPVMPGLAPKIHRGDSRRAFSRGASMAATPRGFDSPRDRSPSVFSMDGGESHYSGNPLAGKVLRIKRMVCLIHLRYRLVGLTNHTGQGETASGNCKRPCCHCELLEKS